MATHTDDLPLTVTRHCAGGCGTPMVYTLESGAEPYAPSLLLVGPGVQFMGGHMCMGCLTAVQAVLELRRPPMIARELTDYIRDEIIKTFADGRHEVTIDQLLGLIDRPARLRSHVRRVLATLVNDKLVKRVTEDSGLTYYSRAGDK